MNTMVQKHPLRTTIQEQFGDEQSLSQHNGAPSYKAKVITKRPTLYKPLEAGL